MLGAEKEDRRSAGSSFQWEAQSRTLAQNDSGPPPTGERPGDAGDNACGLALRLAARQFLDLLLV